MKPGLSHTRRLRFVMGLCLHTSRAEAVWLCIAAAAARRYGHLTVSLQGDACTLCGACSALWRVAAWCLVMYSHWLLRLMPRLRCAQRRDPTAQPYTSCGRACCCPATKPMAQCENRQAASAALHVQGHSIRVGFVSRWWAPRQSVQQVGLV